MAESSRERFVEHLAKKWQLSVDDPFFRWNGKEFSDCTVSQRWFTWQAAEAETKECCAQRLEREAELYEANGKECDAAGHTLGGFGDVNAAIALRRQADAIRKGR